MKNLEFFTQPETLRQIGSRRLTRLFDGFRDDLKTASILLPSAKSENGSYFDSLARILESSAMPDRLRDALFTLETAASSDCRERLDSSIQRRIPTVSLSGCCPLDSALELWFQAPEELSQFQPRNTEHAPQPEPGAAATQYNEAAVQLCSDSPPRSDLFIQQSSNPSIQSGGSPPIHESTNPSIPSSGSPHHSTTPSLQATAAGTCLLELPDVEPWPHPVDGKTLLAQLVRVLSLFIILPKWAAETLALWILHTYAFQLCDVTTYIGIESPEKRCGKTTLLSLLNELANRAVASSNISPPAFFRVIEDLSPTLLIDEVDTFLNGNDQLKGILNSGYKRKTAFVLRAVPSMASNEDPDVETSGVPGAVKRYSCWCPKAMARIGRFPDTLADRCIIIRMHRKTSKEQCTRSRELEALTLRRQCARFVLDHRAEIAAAHPEIPPILNDRAADIWEPLLALADLAGGEWPQLARQAAIGLSTNAQESSPIASLLFDICLVFAIAQNERMFSRTLAEELNFRSTDRPWAEVRKGQPITGLWLAQQLRPYGIRPRTIWIGEDQAKGYYQEDFTEAFQRYVPKAEAQAYLAELTKPAENGAPAAAPADPPTVPPPAKSDF